MIKNKISNKSRNLIASSNMQGRTISLCILILMIFKQFVIYQIYSYRLYDPNIFIRIFNYLGFFANDFMVLGIVLFLVFINLIFNRKFLKIISNIINLILLLLFFIDIIVIYYFQSRLSIIDLSSFFTFSNGSYFAPYVALLIGIFVFFVFAIFIITQKYFKWTKNKDKQFLFVICFFAFSVIFSIVNLFSFKNKSLQENIFTFNISHIKQDNLQISSSKNKYEDYFKTIKGKNKKLNIILIFAESFSAIDSKRVGGLKNNLPYFDKIQSKGITFTNFVAHGCTSETAHIGLLQGIDPREVIGQTKNQTYPQYASFTSSLPEFLNKLGYQTTFLSAVGLDFLNQKDFLSSMKFKTIIGEEAFQNEKKYVFNSAPDHSLYVKALDLVDKYSKNSNPYFLAMQTISSHKPYKTPYGDTEKAMFKYVDANIFAFYSKLEKSGFFKNGILLIISDHRKMEAVGKVEFDKYGYSFKSRALATIVGSGIKPQSINSNIIQHTDLFYSLKYLLGSGNVVVSSLFNNAFTNEVSKDWGISYCRYFSDTKKYGVIKKNGQSYTLRSGYDQNIYDYMSAFEKFQYQRLFTGGTFMPGFFDNSGLIIIAHAGSPFLTTFDSPTGFKLAKENKADGIEFDVSYTKDDQNILMHGPTLASTKCGSGKEIKDFTLSYIQKNCKLLNGDPVLTLEDHLKQNKGLFKYYFLEIKVYDQSKSEKQTLDAINTVLKLGMEKDVIFISYDRMANYIIGSHKDIIAGWDSYYLGEVGLISKFPHEFFLISKDLINSKTVDVADKLNKKFVVYTIDTIEQFQKVYNLGARIIMTNNVPAINKILGR